MTHDVINDKVSITMQGISTMTQKGQIAIPKVIRDHFKLLPHDKVRFSIENQKIVAVPISSVSAMLGVVNTYKKLSKPDEKKAVKKRITQKYENRT